MDVPPVRHSITVDPPDEVRRVRPKCCPFCLAETLMTSWDSGNRCARYECTGCFEVFGRLSGPGPSALETGPGEVVDFRRYCDARASRERE